MPGRDPLFDLLGGDPDPWAPRATSPRQFAKYSGSAPEGHSGERKFLREKNTYGGGTLTDTNYHLAELEPDVYGTDHRWRSHLKMEIQHVAPSVSYADREGTTSGMDWPKAAADLDIPDPKTGTPKLFGMHESPGRSEVFLASGTRQGRAHFGTMLGIAMNETQRDYGRNLTPSEDLSPHSSRVVRHAQQRGLVSPGESAEQTNEMDFEPATVGIPYIENYKEIPKAEVKAGKRTIRRTLKNRKRNR